MKADKSLLWTTVIGVVVRIFLTAFLFHTDTKNIYIESGFINEGWKQAYSTAAKEGRPIYYPPLVYSLVEGYKKAGSFLFSDYFKQWLTDGTALSTENHPHLFRDLLVMKLPMLLSDLLIGYLLFQIVSEKNRRKVVWLWFFNPLTIYAIYGFGNYDILPALLMVLSIQFFRKRKWTLTYTALGLACGLKLFSLLLLPILFLADERSIRQRLTGLLIGVAVFIGSTMTAWVDPTVFKSIFLSNLSGSLLRTRIELTGGVYLPLFISFYFLLLLYLWQKKRVELLSGYLLVLGGLLAISYFNPQWIIWLAPLLVISLSERGGSRTGYLFLIAGYFLSVLLINDKFVGFGILKGVNNAFDSLDPVFLTFSRFGALDVLSGLGRALFFAGVIYFVSVNFLLKKEEGEFSVPRAFLSGAIVLVLFLAIFSGAHFLLAKNGRYIAVSRTKVVPKMALTDKTEISQRIKVDEKNIVALDFRVKNFVARTKENLLIKVSNSDGSEVRDISIDSRLIGDDFDLLVRFSPISDPKGELAVTITMPNTKTGEELLIPYDENVEDGFLSVDKKPIRGSLAYTVYFNPGGWKENIAYSLKRMATKW